MDYFQNPEFSFKSLNMKYKYKEVQSFFPVINPIKFQKQLLILRKEVSLIGFKVFNESRDHLLFTI